jgi:hypothetical protein
MSDREELRDEASMERRREPEPGWQWEWANCNWVRVPVYQEENKEGKENDSN